MKKYLRYIKRIYHLSKMCTEAYPINQTIGSITRIIYLVMAVLLLYFSFALLPPPQLLHGARFEDCVIVLFLFQMCFYSVNSSHFNTYTFQRQLALGGIDHKILLPLPTFLSIMLQELYPQSMRDGIITMLLLGGVMIWTQLSLLEIILLSYILLTSYIILSSLNLLRNSLGLYLEGSMSTHNILQDQLSQLTRYPKSIYPTLLQYLLFPFFFVVSPAFAVLRGTFSVQEALVQGIFTIIILFLGMIIWKVEFKNYSSAN